MNLELLVEVKRKRKQFGHILRIRIHVCDHAFIGSHLSAQMQVIDTFEGSLLGRIKDSSSLDLRI